MVRKSIKASSTNQMEKKKKKKTQLYDLKRYLKCVFDKISELFLIL